MDSFSISGNIVDIINKDIYPGTLVIHNGKIISIELSNETYDQYIMPGFIDAHVHIESSMLVPSEFARLASSHGTLATISDPHEIANVMGVEGIEFMVENSKKVPFKFFFGAPSCVPATPFETSGAIITNADIEKLFEEEKVCYLSEMMNVPGVVTGVPDIEEKIQIAKKYNGRIDGHAPGLSGKDLQKYVTAGVTTDHECVTLEEAQEKAAKGLKIQIRNGSAARNFEALHPMIKSHPSMCMLCSDDKHPDDLAETHIRDLVKSAIEKGYDLWDVLRVVVFTPVKHYQLEYGMVQLGNGADFIVVDNLKDFNVQAAYVGGEKIAEHGVSLIESVEVEPINKFNTLEKHVEEFAVKSTGSKIRVIEAIDGELITKEVIADQNIENGEVVADVEQDILKIVVVNRYKNVGPSIGFIKGFGLKKGAIASSVGHDSHNITAVGTNDEDLLKAVNLVIKNQGGMVAVNGEEATIQTLPIAGLMSNEDGYEVAKKYKALNEVAKTYGSRLLAPFMTLSFMALLVIPSLKLSDKGLFDGNEFKFVDLQLD